MSGLAALAAALSGLAAALLITAPARVPARGRADIRADVRAGDGSGAGAEAGQRDGVLRRWRPLWSLCAGLGAAVTLGGPLALPAGCAAAVGVWVVAGRLEPADLRRRREEIRRDLPHVVTLLASALRSGAAPAAAITLVGRALPGAAAERLQGLAARLELGADPVALWTELASDPALGPLGRTMARTHRSGAPVVAAVERLGEELASRGRAEVEDRARAVGVKAAVPLGVCLLPAFLLLGIVPLVASLAGALAW